MASPLIESHARNIASTVPVEVGIDPVSLITIITALIPLLTSCFKQTEPVASPREYLEDQFDENTGTFDQSLINRCRPQTRRASRKEGQRKLSRWQLDEISAATLLQAKDDPEANVDSCMVACQAISTE